jgi:hypothetical protein
LGNSLQKRMKTELPIIGRNAVITIDGIAKVPAKIDTGADGCSVWATGIREEPDGLHFCLFGPESPYYTGDEVVVQPDQYHQIRIVSSTGGRQVRYVVDLPVEVEGHAVIAGFSLADRRTLAYPILLGCSFLAHRFLVDCAKQIPADIHTALIHNKQARRRAAAQ